MSVRTVVLLIDDLAEWTGTEVHLYRLLCRLDQRRIRPVVAVVGRSELAPEFRKCGIPVVPLGIQRALAPEGALGIRRIARLLRRERARLLVCYHTASDLLGPLAARVAGVPVLSCRRDEGFTKKRVHVVLQRPLNHLLRGMLSVSHSVVRAVARIEGYPSERTQVIWNGEDLDKFSPGPSPVRRELGIPEGACVITSVSLLSPVKDHRTQLRAMAALLREHPEAVLLLAGDGPLREEVQQMAAPLGPRVHLLGHRGDVPDLLRASDIFLQTSLSEGFSNSILQAMATRLPVVVTRVGGNPELVDRDSGYLVETRKPEVIARHLSELVANAEARRRMGGAARRRVERYCSLPVMVDTYTDAFERAMDDRFPGPSSGSEH